MTSLRRLRERTVARDDDGFSLLEVIVSFTLFLIVATAATYGIVHAIDSAHASQQRTGAANAAAQQLASDIALYRQTNVLPRTTTTPARIALGTEQFLLTQSVAFVGSATACTSGAAFTIHVEARQSGTTALLAQSDSVVACI